MLLGSLSSSLLLLLSHREVVVWKLRLAAFPATQEGEEEEDERLERHAVLDSDDKGVVLVRKAWTIILEAF